MIGVFFVLCICILFFVMLIYSSFLMIPGKNSCNRGCMDYILKKVIIKKRYVDIEGHVMN